MALCPVSSVRFGERHGFGGPWNPVQTAVGRDSLFRGPVRCARRWRGPRWGPCRWFPGPWGACMFRQEGGVLQHWPAVLQADGHGGLTRRSFSRVSRLRDPRGPGFSGIQVTFLGSDLQLCLRLFPLLPYALCLGGTSLRPPPPTGTSRGPCGWACGRRVPELRQPRKGGPVLHGGPCEQPQSGLRPRHPPVPAGRLLPFPCLLPPAAHSHHPPGLGARHLLWEAFSGLPTP